MALGRGNSRHGNTFAVTLGSGCGCLLHRVPNQRGRRGGEPEVQILSGQAIVLIFYRQPLRARTCLWLTVSRALPVTFPWAGRIAYPTMLCMPSVSVEARSAALSLWTQEPAHVDNAKPWHLHGSAMTGAQRWPMCADWGHLSTAASRKAGPCFMSFKIPILALPLTNGMPEHQSPSSNLQDASAYLLRALAASMSHLRANFVY